LPAHSGCCGYLAALAAGMVGGCDCLTAFAFGGGDEPDRAFWNEAARGVQQLLHALARSSAGSNNELETGELE
jgi:hypothetical protein